MVTLKQTGPNEYKSFKYEVNIKKRHLNQYGKGLNNHLHISLKKQANANLCYS